MVADRINIPVSEAMKSLTLHISFSGVRVFRWRLRIAKALFSLGGKVAGCGISVNDDPVAFLQSKGYWAAADLLLKKRDGNST